MTQPIPASKQLASHCRSGRGACGFVLVADSEVTWSWCYFRVEADPPGTQNTRPEPLGE